jgi:hypothetical protein
MFQTRHSYYIIHVILLYMGFSAAFSHDIVRTKHSFHDHRPARTTSTYDASSLLPISHQHQSNLSRKHFIHYNFLSGLGIVVLTSLPNKANADLQSAAEAGLPLVGRFEALKGAKAFIGAWEYEATVGIPSGKLVFLKNGEVELRDTKNEQVMGVGAVPWKYGTVKGSENLVVVTFTLDQDQEDVLIYEGILDSAGGPERVMEGTVSIGRAEIGARGSGPRKEVGTFSATFIHSVL